MTHRFPIKEIALQAGLGTATVDRVINNRAHVSPQTTHRVHAAIRELERQEAQMAARGRRMFFDFVIEAPARFSREVQNAATAVLPGISAAVCRPRFTLQDTMTEDEVIQTLARIAKRGSQGLCLKARNLPSVGKAIDHLTDLGIPVVTLVTDIPASTRLAYVGLNNESAGRTAAYLIAQALPDGTGTVLTTKSQSSFLGEEERETAFTTSLLQRCPDLNIIDSSGGSGIGRSTTQQIEKILDQLGDLRAVYSMGGGNRAILDILNDHTLKPDIFVAHDLDHENAQLIAQGRLNYVLHHDLHTDVRNAYLAFLRYHKLLAFDRMISPSGVQIISPENIPLSER